MSRNKKNQTNSFADNYEEFLQDRLSVIRAAKNGIKASNIFLVREFYNFNKNFIAHMLNLSAKTLDRYAKENRRLNPNDSELIIKLILLYKKGIEIFGDQASYIQWLNQPAYGLGNQAPVDLVNTSGGIDLIIEELGRIEFGDVS